MLISGGLLVTQGALSIDKVLLPEEKCHQNLENLAKTISGNLNSFVFYGKSSAAKPPSKKELPAPVTTATDTTVSITIGADSYDFTVSDMYECKVDKLIVIRAEL